MEVEVNQNNQNIEKKNDIYNSIAIDSQMNNLINTEEGQKIISDIELLTEMGYDRKMINKVYILLHPDNIERAIDYMNIDNGIIQHNFFENHNSEKDKNICFICKKSKIFHIDNASEINDNINNSINDNIHNNVINNIDINNNNSNNFKLQSNLSFDISFTNERIINKTENYQSSFECSICYEIFDEKEKESNTLPCGHFCCKQCWLNYFKTFILEANVDEIKCTKYDCSYIILEEFILEHIKEDQNLVDKYKKFKLRAEILKDENKKLCPYPDCESYLEKSKKSKYVKCQIGHEYCFECLKPPHGDKICESLDKKFLNWKKNKRVKKFPKCKIFTEKNEGCNHMTCSNCKYQWCWLCEEKYNYEHYSSGKCKGHQYTRADNIKDINCCGFTIESIFPCYYSKGFGIIDINNIFLRYLFIFGLWFFGYFIFAGFSMHNFTKHKSNIHYKIEKIYYFLGIFIAFGLLVSFQLLFTIFITPFIIISIFKPNFLDNILNFLNICD